MVPDPVSNLEPIRCSESWEEVLPIFVLLLPVPQAPDQGIPLGLRKQT